MGGVAAGPRFSQLKDGALKAYAARVVVQLERASGDREQELRSELAALRDEMINRLVGHGGHVRAAAGGGRRGAARRREVP